MAKTAGWARRIALWACALVVLALAGGAACKYWLIPSVMRGRFQRELPTYWKGTGRIEGIDFNFFGPTRLRGLSLRDHAGREWVRVGSASLKMRGLFGSFPVLYEVDVDELFLQGHVAEKKFVPWPLKPLDELWQYVDLQAASVKPITAALRDEHGRRIEWERIEFSLTRGPSEAKDQRYQIEVKDGDGQPSPSLRCTGWVDCRTLAWRFEGGVDRRLTPEEVGNVAAVLGVADVGGAGASSAPAGRSADGTLVLAAELAGLGVETGTLGGGGRVELTNVALPWRPNGIGRLLDLLGIGPGDHLRFLEASFKARKTRIVFERLRAEDNRMGYDVKPGGWVDWSTMHADLFVAAANRNAKGTLSSIPVVSWLMGGAEGLIGVRIRGSLGRPLSELMVREPVRDLSEAAREFLQGVGGRGAGGPSTKKAR